MKLFTNNKGKVCGWWQNGVYRKKVDSRMHRLRVLDAYGIDRSIVVELEKLGTNEIRILETNTEIVYSVSFADFVRFGVVGNYESEQIFLPMQYWKVDKNLEV